MNRQQRRAAERKSKKAAKSRHLSMMKEDGQVIAFHEAGHAVARYLTAEEMGYSKDECIFSVEMSNGSPVLSNSVDGQMILVTQATTFGPTYSKELDPYFNDVYADALPASGIQKNVKSFEVELDLEDLRRKAEEAEAGGVDIDKWLKANALIAVMGPIVEAQVTKQEVDVVLDSYVAENDVGIFVRNCRIGNRIDRVEEYYDSAIDEAIKHLEKTNTRKAIWDLGTHLMQYGTTSGKVAAKIIKDVFEDEQSNVNAA